MLYEQNGVLQRQEQRATKEYNVATINLLPWVHLRGKATDAHGEVAAYVMSVALG